MEQHALFGGLNRVHAESLQQLSQCTDRGVQGGLNAAARSARRGGTMHVGKGSLEFKIQLGQINHRVDQHVQRCIRFSTQFNDTFHNNVAGMDTACGVTWLQQTMRNSLC